MDLLPKESIQSTGIRIVDSTFAVISNLEKVDTPILWAIERPMKLLECNG